VISQKSKREEICCIYATAAKFSITNINAAIKTFGLQLIKLDKRGLLLKKSLLLVFQGAEE
jgi:hypothetical protein